MKTLKLPIALSFFIVFSFFSYSYAQTTYLSSVNVTPSTANINIGGTQQLNIQTRDQYGNSISGANTTYTSSNPSVATVNSNGLITAVGNGVATITATSASGNYTVQGSSTVTVGSSGNPYLNDIVVTPATTNLNIGGTQQLTVQPRDQSGTSFTGATTTYSSSNPAVATVDSNGLVRAISNGTTTITSTSSSGGRTVTGSSTITVGSSSSSTPYLNYIVVSPSTISLNAGGTQQLTIQPRDQFGVSFTGATTTYTSSNPAVATVNSNGVITAVGNGTTTITATSTNSGRTVIGTSSVTVGTQATLPSACAGVTFTQALKLGSRGEAVRCLQALLNKNVSTQVAASGAGSIGNETTYFGTLTKQAVTNFQEKYSSDILSPLGLTSGTGYFGTATRAKMGSLFGI